ncbi:7963_t:CDS:2 [Acaulospora morrowiae]|uniref:7963_t:CDS:1 n=1 Tax=Acaulospora morrowiae TaxID=94023 RepID=A0A9N8W6G1_9GLOM|nr:7963_t:CDS:2 [Acaulospora morrowiae]
MDKILFKFIALVFFISLVHSVSILRKREECIKCASYVPENPFDPSESTTLKSCLKYVTGKVLYRDDDEYYNNIKGCNCRTIYYPIAIVYAANVADVQESVNCGNQLGISVVARSGGHSYEDYSLGGRNGVLVVDVANFDQIVVDEESQTAVVGTGNKVGPIYYGLSQYGYLLPTGSCSNVGIGGQATGGGYGFVGRKYGMASDNIVAAEVVLANGTFLSPVNSSSHSDLFFALRGAGNAGYGIITSLTIQIYPVPEKIVYFHLSYDDANIQSVFDAYNQIGPSLDESFSLYLTLSPKTIWGNNSCASADKINLFSMGTYLGSLDEAVEGLSDYLNASSPIEPEFTETTWYEELLSFVGGGNLESLIDPEFDPEPFKVKSFFIDSPGLTEEAVTVLQTFINTVKCRTLAMFELIGGGVNNNFSPNETAFVHRNSLYLLQFEMKLRGVDEEVRKECLDDIRDFSVMFQEKYTSYYSYQNYIDSELLDWEHRYYGQHFERLVEIKAKYDPNNLFNWNQSIPISI